MVQVAKGSDDSDRSAARFSDPGLLAVILALLMFGIPLQVDSNSGLSAQYLIELSAVFHCLVDFQHVFYALNCIMMCFILWKSAYFTTGFSSLSCRALDCLSPGLPATRPLGIMSYQLR